MSAVLLTRSRGDALEAEHLGSVAVVDHTGQVVFSAGDIDRPLYPRSAIKLLHALPFLESGAASAFSCSAQEIALSAASHTGDDAFVEILRAWATRLGVDDASLICGPDTPLSPRVAQRLIRGAGSAHVFHNNNVGKHLAIITTCLHLGEPIEGYERPEHPAQKRILETVEALCGPNAEVFGFAIDNCGLPTYPITACALALGMARLGAAAHKNPVSAAARLISAIRAQPEFLGGPKRLVTQLLKMTGGQVIVKGGSEGVFTVSVPAKGLGIVLKVQDGSGEASSAILVEFLSRSGLLPQGAIQPLQQRVNVWHRAETPDRSPRLHFPAFADLPASPVHQIMLLAGSEQATMHTRILMN